MKGRVYERRSDVSADGSLFAAFIRQSGPTGSREPPSAETWVAVSRPPYFTALAVWFVGGTYYTGAFFPDRSSLWHGFQEQPPDIGSVPAWLETTPPLDIAYIDRTNEWTDRTVHFNRLLRDGWQKTADDGPYTTTWERQHPGGPLRLRMRHRFEDFSVYGGPYVVQYSVCRPDAAEADLGQATWADWDQQGRLVLARDGRLLVWDETGGFQELENFNGQTPDPQPAPDRATTWPKPPVAQRRRSDGHSS